MPAAIRCLSFKWQLMMNILHTVEFYSPSVGGAQEVVRQISERLAGRGHNVTVATTRLAERQSLEIDGVKIQGFDISGNAVWGMRGEVERYQKFLLEGRFDVMLNYAAQQWTMDAAFPVLDRLPYRKVMVPCGFSSLYNPAYRGYFLAMPKIMHLYDHLVFPSSDYRDIRFAREHGLEHYSVIPNGADEREFGALAPDFRTGYGITVNEPLLLTIGSHTGQKGHRLCLDAFQGLKRTRATLVIIGNVIAKANWWKHCARPVLGALRRREVGRARDILFRILLVGLGSGCLPECRAQARWINLHDSGKRVLVLDPPRQDVVAALQAADLFVFGSNIECSPLVLFEAMAAGTPFLSLACGNAQEIAAWGRGGRIAPTLRQPNGEVDGAPPVFSQEIDALLDDPQERARMGAAGQQAWREHFTWEKIALRYETLYNQLAR